MQHNNLIYKVSESLPRFLYWLGYLPHSEKPFAPLKTYFYNAVVN